MRRYISPLCLLLFAVFALSSCMDEDETEVTLYNDIAITAFQITSAKAERHTLSSTGEDSVFTVTDETLKYYPFSIDHINGLIFNRDSMPAGTDAEKMLCSFSTKNNGVVVIENILSDSVKYLTTTDTTDFRVPRYLNVYSSDYSTSRKYRVTVNIHRERAGVFGWNRLADNGAFAAMTGLRAVVIGNSMAVIGNENGSTVIYSSALDDGNTWTRSAATLGGDVYNNVAVRNDSLFVLDGGMLKASVDGGSTFADVAPAAGVARLLGCGTAELHAIGTDGHLMVSADGGLTWTKDTEDIDFVDGAPQMPTQDITYSCTPFAYGDSTDYVLIAGNRSVADFPADGHAMVLRKVAEYSHGSRPGRWISLGTDGSYAYRLPRLAGLTVFGYDGSLLATGLGGIGTCDAAPLSQFYESRDGGITWKPNSTYTMPEGIDPAATSLAATADSSGNVWLVCGGTGQVWRGRLSSFGWTK